MILVYSHIPVIEEILVKRLQDYFLTTIKWDSLYPKFPIRINNEYPWVPFMTDVDLYVNGGIDLNKVNEALFPSITVVTSQDSNSPSLFLDAEKTALASTEYNDLVTQAAEYGYYITDSDLAEIETYFQSNDYLFGINFREQRRDTINIDITTDDNSVIKDRIYSYVQMFLAGQGSADLQNELDIGIIKPTVTGTRSGIYNIDFGRTLRGSTIQFEVDYKISQCMYDTSIGLITDVTIDHTVGG